MSPSRIGYEHEDLGCVFGEREMVWLDDNVRRRVTIDEMKEVKARRADHGTSTVFRLHFDCLEALVTSLAIFSI